MFCLRMFKTGIVATICLFNAEYEFSSGIIVHTLNKRNEMESCPAIDSIEKKKERERREEKNTSRIVLCLVAVLSWHLSKAMDSWRNRFGRHL